MTCYFWAPAAVNRSPSQGRMLLLRWCKAKGWRAKGWWGCGFCFSWEGSFPLGSSAHLEPPDWQPEAARCKAASIPFPCSRYKASRAPRMLHQLSETSCHFLERRWFATCFWLLIKETEVTVHGILLAKQSHLGEMELAYRADVSNWQQLWLGSTPLKHDVGPLMHSLRIPSKTPLALQAETDSPIAHFKTQKK